MNMYRLTLSTLLAGVLLSALLPTAALAAPAQPKTTGQGFELSPPIHELEMDPGATRSAKVFLRNITSVPMVVRAEPADFVAAGEDGQPKLLTEGKSSGATSMSKWFVPLPDTSIQPGEQKELTITIKAPANASPGGHYAAMKFSSGASNVPKDQSAVALTASVATLFLVSVSGDVKESIDLTAAYASQNGKKSPFFSDGKNILLVQRFTNTGNVHLKPSGIVSVTDQFGKRVARLDLNETKGSILPGSVRQFDQLIEKRLAPGRYTAKMLVTYANGKQFERSMTFWVVPVVPVAGVLVGLGLVAVLGRRYRLAKR